jgi:hypothetical protein
LAHGVLGSDIPHGGILGWIKIKPFAKSSAHGQDSATRDMILGDL